ncbi:MAG: biliverdin-producing heme oxygenase [Bacteroidota bacterium]
MNEVLLQLKLATQELHDLTEQHAHAAQIRAGTLTRSQYETLLSKNYHIHTHLEEAIQSSPAFPEIQDFFLTRTPWLEQDLKHLHLPPKTFFPPASLNFNQIPQLIGALYVVEGSMLGGRMIAKLLQRQAEFTDCKAFHFYEGKGAATKNRWKVFATLAEKYITTSEEQTAAKTAAIQTFQFFLSVYQN